MSFHGDGIEPLRGRLPILKSLLPPFRAIPSARSDDQEVYVELDRILASEFFRSSKRCQSFLTYVVKATLSGDEDRLKERILGMEVFGRSPAYDTGEDAIVRVKANEVRRRLAQYNVTADPRRSVKIEVLPGSYVPQFRRSSPVTPTVPVAKQSARKKWAAILAAGFLVLAGASYTILHSSDPLHAFWQPVLTVQTSPIICFGNPDTYLPDYPGQSSPPALQFENGKFKPVTFSTSNSKPIGDPTLMRVPDSVVGIGDSNAGFLIGRTLQSLGRSSRARLSDQVSFSDLKGSPVVLVGAFTNRWTMSMTSNLRFSFAFRNGRHIVIDRNNPSQLWEVPSMRSTGKASEDYAVVTRLLSSPAGQGLICAAGIGNYGSEAAGEFITDAKSLEQLIQRAPKNWEHMNMQVVLKTKVVNDTPSPAEIVAVNFW